MSFVFKPGAHGRKPTESWASTACAWRGACLEIYARGERSIDDCIAELEKLTGPIGHEAHHPGAAARARALNEMLGRNRSSVHHPAAIRNLQNWIRLVAERPFLAHGVMKARHGGVTIALSAHDGSSRNAMTPKHLNPFEMIAYLRRIDHAQRALNGQLGQVRAAARRVRGGSEAA